MPCSVSRKALVGRNLAWALASAASSTRHDLRRLLLLVQLLRRREDRLGAAHALLEQPVGVTEQSNKGNERRDAAHARGYAKRGIGDRTERDRDRAATDHAVDHGDDRCEGEELLAP